jgi:hypothetical protein
MLRQTATSHASSTPDPHAVSNPVSPVPPVAPGPLPSAHRHLGRATLRLLVSPVTMLIGPGDRAAELVWDNKRNLVR